MPSCVNSPFHAGNAEAEYVSVFREARSVFSDALESLAGMARLADLALEPLEGTCRAGGIMVKRP